MEEFDLALITKRSIRGVFTLISRTLFIQLISLVANFLLTVFLTPAEFGIFFFISASISILTYFSDIGLAAALIQKKDKISDQDLRTTFTIQQVLIFSLVSIGFLLSGLVGDFYDLNPSGIQLFQALVIAFYLSSLKTIPSIILERSLRFEKLVIPQIVETFVFNAVALYFAVQGYGITSFAYAVLARGIVGVIAMYIIAPWKISIGFEKKSAKELLSFGVPFQLNSVLALVKDNLLFLYLGKILPVEQVGYIGFGMKWAYTPLQLIMDNIIRITFPSFSRLAEDAKSLSRGIEKTLFATTFFIFPALVGLVILAPYFVEFIPRYEKWQPALLSLGFFAANASLSTISTTLTNALNAIGKIRTTLYFMIFWTIATWVATPIAITVFGFNGVAIASAAIALSVVPVVLVVQRYIAFDLIRSIRYPAIGSIVLALFLLGVSPLVVKNMLMLFAMIIAGASVYLGVLFLFAKREIIADLQTIKRHLKK